MKTETTSSIFQFFFSKTIFGTLLLIFIIVAGVMAYNSLVKEAYPDIKIPFAVVITSWQGAPPELVEKKITIPLENRIASLKGLKEYESRSELGVSYVEVMFRENQPIDQSIQKLREVVNSTANQFPKDAETPIVEQALFSSWLPVVTFTLYGDVDEVLLDKIAQRLKDRFQTIPGLQKVEISGNRAEIIKILMIPSRLSAMGISSVTVMNAITNTELFTPVGKFEHQEVNSLLTLDARIRNSETLRKLPVTRLQGGKGRIVRLGELAYVRRELEDAAVRTSVSFEGGEYGKTVDITLYKSPGQDTIKLVEQARKILEEAQKAGNWPQKLQYKAVSDQAADIKDDLSKVLKNAGQTMLAVFLVLVIMLTWRESLVAGLSIPLTFLGTLAILWAIGYTLNTLVFIGLIIALGLLVDDFILVMEGMHAAHRKGFSLSQAQTFTIKTYAVPSFSGSITTILSFLPILTISGFIGQFLRSIPMTTVICLALSYLISILIDVPLSSAIFSKRHQSIPKQSRVDQLASQSSERLNVWLQNYTVRNKWIASLWLVGTVVMFTLSILAYQKIPRMLNPREDSRNLGITIELPPGTVLDQSQQVADHVGEILRPMAYFENITKYVGMRSSYTPHSSETERENGSHLIGFSCKFVPEKAREKKSYEYVPEIRQILEAAIKDFPEALLSVSEAQRREGSKAPIEIEIYGPGMSVVRRLAKDVQHKLETVSGAVNVRNDLGKIETAWRIEPIREALDFYQISATELSAQLNLFLGTNKIGKIMTADTEDELDMYLGMAWPSRQGKLGGPTTWQELERMSIINAYGQRIHPASLVRFHVEDTPTAIIRENGRTSVTVQANDEERSSSEILQDFLPQLDGMQQTWPTGYGYKLGGEAEEMEELVSSVKRAFVFAVVLIFATLAMIFGSFRQTLIILCSVPFALIGTFLGFFLTGMSFSSDAAVGIIALAGIAVNDAIVLIDTMNNYHRNGLSIKEAATRGAGDRLRPILSTSITTIAGLVPLALSDEAWRGLCSTIIFGLVASTLISLYVIPALYLLFTPQRKEVARELSTEVGFNRDSGI